MQLRLGRGIQPLLLILAAFGAAASGVAQPLQFRQREVLDPNTTEWTAKTPTDRSGVFDEARRLLAAGEADDARKLLADWIKANPLDDAQFRARFLLGEAYFALADYWKAAEQFDIVADNTAGELFYSAIERSIDTALAFLSGEPRILWGFLRLPAYDDGVRILDRAWSRVPGTALGELALRLKADYLYESGDYDRARDAYSFLVREYPNGRYHRAAMLRAAQAAYAAYPGDRFDDQALIDAAELYDAVRDVYPQYAERENVDDWLDTIVEQRAEKALAVAEWYLRANYTTAGRFYFRRIVARWPQTLAADTARARLREMGVLAEPSEPGR